MVCETIDEHEMRNVWRNFTRGIRNMCAYRKAVWNDYTCDWTDFYPFMLVKIRRVREHMEYLAYRGAIPTEAVAEEIGQMIEAEAVLKRLIADQYEDCASCEADDSRKMDQIRLYELLRDHAASWWI